jgi:hypothetical protein
MPKALPQLTNDDTGEVLPVRQYPFPQRGTPATLLINGTELPARFTQWRDLKYTYFQLEGGQFFVAGHLDERPGYTLSVPEGFTPTAFKNDRATMAARAAELRAAKTPKQDESVEAVAEAVADKPKRGKRKAAQEEPAQA